MPYLKPADRKEFEHVEVALATANINSSGQLNYLITLLLLRTMKDKQINYTLLNGMVGALECSKQEFIRRVLSSYEDTKIHENGDLY